MSHRFLLAVALLASAWLMRPATAHACSCAPLTPAEGLAQSTAVFEGRVLAITELAEPPLPHREVTFAVVRSWKGVESIERLVVKTAADSAACGYGFAPDTSYLVYARATDGAQWASLCSRTAPMADADEDLNVLGMGQTPVDPNADGPAAEPEPEPPARGGCASCAVGAVRPVGTTGSWSFGMLFAVLAWRWARTRRLGVFQRPHPRS